MKELILETEKLIEKIATTKYGMIALILIAVIIFRIFTGIFRIKFSKKYQKNQIKII